MRSDVPTFLAKSRVLCGIFVFDPHDVANTLGSRTDGTIPALFSSIDPDKQPPGIAWNVCDQILPFLMSSQFCLIFFQSQPSMALFAMSRPWAAFSA
jgi:hypothetical protein